MIFELEDIIDEVCHMFPDIEESSVKKICKSGLSGINKLMRSGEELYIKMPERKEVKFFIPATPEVQAEITKINAIKRKKKKENEDNG